jgi:hypothetical protein
MTISIVSLPGTTGPFVVRENFVVGVVGIVFLSDDFETQFLNKTEKPMSETTLCYGDLAEFPMKASILAQLGGRAETTLTQIWMLMEQQANGKADTLLTGKNANIFCVRDVNNQLRAVLVFRRAGGWVVGTHSISVPHRWRGESRVFRSS